MAACVLCQTAPGKLILLRTFSFLAVTGKWGVGTAAAKNFLSKRTAVELSRSGH